MPTGSHVQVDQTGLLPVPAIAKGAGYLSPRVRARMSELQLTQADLYDAVMEGAVERVRPKMMTVVAIMAGLLPIMWSTGTGSEIMQRIAVPMIGGMISSTLLTLIVIPAIFGLVKGFKLPDDDNSDNRSATPTTPTMRAAERIPEPAQ